MAVDRKVTAKTLGKAFAELIRDDEAVRELWVTEDAEGFVVAIITSEIDMDQERALYRASGPVQRQFPDALFEVQVNVPTRYPTLDFDEFRLSVVPAGALKIPLEH